MESNKKETKTVIADDIEIVGSIKCTSNIQIDGKLNGDLNCNGDAVIGGTANVKGNLSVNSITVLGQINGNINAKDRIELKSTAHINGDIRAKRLTVEDGVTFVGKSEVNPSGAARAPVQPESKSSVLRASPELCEGGSGVEWPAASGAEGSVREISPSTAEETLKEDEEIKGKTGGIFGRK